MDHSLNTVLSTAVFCFALSALILWVERKAMGEKNYRSSALVGVFWIITAFAALFFFPGVITAVEALLSAVFLAATLSLLFEEQGEMVSKKKN